MAKQFVTGKEARQKIFSGVKQLADIVTITLSPKGRNVGIEKKWINNVLLHDGVSVAREIDLPDPFENFSAQLVKEASSKTNDKAGDGTTTSTLLAYKMLELGIAQLDLGVNPMTMKKGMDLAVKDTIAYLEKIATPVDTKEKIAQVATISSANPEIGNLIAEIMQKVGKDGVISVEEHARMTTDVEYKEGMEFDKGYITPLFSTNLDKMEAELLNPLILITDHTITSASDMGGFLKRIVEATKRAEIVIIASSIDGTALSTLLLNKERGGVTPLGIYAPSFAERRKDVLEDIAVLTGGIFVSRDKYKMDDIKPEMLGKSDSIWCDGDRTKIVGGFGTKENIDARASQIRDLIEKTDSDFEKLQLKQRLARLISGAAIIKVGGFTELELKEKKERVIDAVEATKSAVEEGVIPGGGIALYNYFSSRELPNLQKDEFAGYEVVMQSLKSPMIKILTNAGMEDKIEKMNGVSDGMGYNVETEEFGNMMEMGITDPLKVTKNALINACSIASMLLTTETIICDLPEHTKENNKEEN